VHVLVHVPVHEAEHAVVSHDAVHNAAGQVLEEHAAPAGHTVEPDAPAMLDDAPLPE